MLWQPADLSGTAKHVLQLPSEDEMENPYSFKASGVCKAAIASAGFALLFFYFFFFYFFSYFHL